MKRVLFASAAADAMPEFEDGCLRLAVRPIFWQFFGNIAKMYIFAKNIGDEVSGAYYAINEERNQDSFR